MEESQLGTKINESRKRGCSQSVLLDHHQGGMTLIELMVVVAIIGVLATIAMVSYTKSTNKAKISTEVAAMFAELKIRQEAYQVENGSYLSTGTSETDVWPGAPTGTTAPMEIYPLPNLWKALRFQSDKSAVLCSYVSISGSPGDASPVGSVASTDFSYVPPNNNWYYILAECDANNDPTINSYYFARSDREGIAKFQEGK